MPKPDKPLEISKGIIKADIIAAGQAIKYFKTHRNKDIKNIAAYHLQQAVEKIINQIYESTSKINNSKMFTHNIEGLIAYSESLNIKIIIPELIRENSLIITKWEAGSRYGLGLSIRITTLTKFYQEIQKWFNTAL